MGMQSSLVAELPIDTAAYVAVAAYNQFGESPISQVRQFQIKPNTSGLASPLLSYSMSGNVVTAEWSAVPGAVGYRIYVTPYLQQSPVQVIDVGNLTSISESVPIGTSANVSVVAYNAGGSSDLSETQILKVDNSANKPALTTRATGSGQGVLKPSGGQYSPGSVVSVWPSPHLYSYFHSWTNASSCAGGTGGCRVTMDSNKRLEARFEPIVWSYQGTFQYTNSLNSSTESCTWAVTWSNVRIEIYYRLQTSGTYLGYLTLTGQKKAVPNKSGCNPSEATISRSTTFAPSGNSLNVRFLAWSGAGNEYMTISTNNLNSGSFGGTLASINVSYEGTNRSGSTSLFVTLGQTGAGHARR